MPRRGSIAAIAMGAALAGIASFALAADQSSYPDWRGQWMRVDRPNWTGTGVKPPLTPEYQAIYDANLADMKKGGVGDVPSTFCYPMGMPMMMNVYDPWELIVTPEVTYILTSHVNDSYRRIFTDGRDWPSDADPTFAGYSIGKWLDTDGDGTYDELQVETRNLKGPRVIDATGVPLHHDNQSVIKERFWRDKADPDMLYDELTIYDHALTKPWTRLNRATRNPDPRPNWVSDVCAEANVWMKIEGEAYYMGADGKLMPVKKDQRPPDLEHFTNKGK
jgi:hypothetical protein